MIISHKHKFILYQPPKCAGSSLQIALGEFCGPEDIYTPMPQRPDVDETKLDKHTKTWNYDHDKGHHQHASPAVIKPQDYPGYRTICVVRNPWDLHVSFYHWYGLKNITFKESVTKTDIFKWNLNEYWDYKHNFMLRFENLQEDYDKMCEKLGLEAKDLPRLKTLKRPKGDNYREYYDDTLKGHIASKYANIINKYGYKF